MNTQTGLLLQEKMTGARMLEPIKITDTVHSWLNMLNRVIDVCNIVAYPDPNPLTTTYANVFGFMEATDKLYLDKVKWGVLPADNESAIDINVRKLTSFEAIKQVRHATADKSVSISSGTVIVDKNSIDVQCIDARSNVELRLIANPDPAWYCEKLVSIKALNEVHITYAVSSDDEVAFVNNSVYPNVEWSTTIGTPTTTLLLANMFIVYRIIFIHGRILIEVVENTQIIDNYKTASAKFSDSSLNGFMLFDAESSTLSFLTGILRENDGSCTTYINVNGAVTTEYSSTRCISSFEAVSTTGETAQWTSVILRCRPNGSASSLLNSASVNLKNGRHIIQLWSEDRTMVVKVDYALNMEAKILSILGFTVIKMNSGRTYDE